MAIQQRSVRSARVSPWAVLGVLMLGSFMSLLDLSPAQVVAQLHHLAAAVFAHGYADAMRPTLVVPLALVLLAAVSTVAVRRGTRTPAEQTTSPPRAEPQSVA